jgi:ankyrin repeat protein
MPKLDKDFLPEVEILDSICAGLVTIDEESNVIRLAHYTTLEYFQRTQKDWFPNAQTDIATTCITYLSFDAFEAGFCLTDNEFEKRLQLNPLYDYAARNWGHHASAAPAEVERSAVDFLKSEAKIFSSSQAMMASRDYFGYSQRVPKQMIGLHLAAYFGLREAMIALLNNGYDRNVKDTYRQTPLSWAVRNGHEAVVKLLLEKDAELESKDAFGQTPLWWALLNRHKVVVGLLLEKGANAEFKSSNGQTPLWWALLNRHEAMLKLLLEKGAKLESKSSNGQTPLLWAVYNKHEAVVKLLLEKGAELESKDNNSRTPLSYAAALGHEVVVKLLLEKGAELDTKDDYSQTPLLWATEYGHKAVVKLLLEKGAELDTESTRGGRTS